jgi:signal transduction histidine kinase
VSILFILGILGTALWATYRGYANARFFLIAFTPFLVAALGRLGDAFGLILGGNAVYYLYLLASIIHATLLMTAILVRDAAQRRTSEQLKWQLMRLREDLANRALFMRMLAHEVRTPLAIIDSYSQLLGSHAADHGTSGTAADTGAGIMTQAEQIRAAVRRLAAILDRFLRQDRFTSVERVEWVPLDLDRLIADTVAEVQRQSEDHLLRYCSAAKDLRISGDPDLLRILLLNLLENAVHYSPEGGSIQVGAAAEDGGVTIAVSDEGVGIPAEARERIFDRYYRTSQVKDAIGAGLGLYIVRSIARLHGGDVWCDSTLGEGSTFRVSLRRTRAG